MSRGARLAFAALATFLALLPLTLAKPGLPVNLKADEPAYYLMALSLARDRDLRLDVEDVDRVFEEFPLVPVNNLIVMSDDGWRTILYSKPLLHPLLGAPFVAAFGANGLLLLNMLLVSAMVWMGARHLRRHNDDGLALALSAAFVLLSCGFAYAFWIHTEIFCMTAIAAACFLVMGAAERERRPGLLAPLGAGAALAAAAYNKPMYALVGAALVIAAWRAWRWRGAAAFLAGAAALLAPTVMLSQALTGRATPYLGSQQRAGVSICSPGKLPIGPAADPEAAPEPAAPMPATETASAPIAAAPAIASLGGAGAPAAVDPVAAAAAAPESQSEVDPPAARLGAAPGDPATGAGTAVARQRDTNWGFVLRVPRIDPRELAESVSYFLWGRHTGFLLYFPFGVLALVLFAIDGRRDPERWLLLATLVGIALYFLLFIPVNWQGGGGFVGNRYYVAVYPAFLYLVRRVRPAALMLPAVAAASLFLGPLLLSPFGAAVPEPTLQAHVRNLPFRFFPLELSLKNVPGYHGFPVAGARLVARRDQVVPFGESMWVRGADRVEVWIESASPVERPTFLVEGFGGGNEVTLAIGDARETLTFDASGETRTVTLAPDGPTRRRHRDGSTSWVYRLVARSSSGSVESWTRGRTRRGCGDFVFEEPATESFYAGVGLTYLGDAAAHERDLFAPAWGESRVPATVEAGSRFTVATVVTNRSEHAWEPAGSARIHLSYHWLDPGGATVVFDGLRTELPNAVTPGATLRVEQAVEAPAVPGSYLLELDLVFEHVAWFGERNGGRTFRAPVEVIAASPPG
jgi:hypothetical protein